MPQPATGDTMSLVLGAAWYRLRATWHGRRGGYLALVILVALVGGLAMGAIAAARRTQSSYPAYLASTNPSQLTAVTAVLNPAIGNGSGYNSQVVRAIGRVPEVTRVATSAGLNIVPLAPGGAPVGNAYLPVSPGEAVGSVSAEGISVDRFSIIAGRRPDPANPGEFMTTAAAARAFGFLLGQVISMGIYTNAQTELPGFGTARVQPYRRIEVKLVGLAVLPDSLVQDDVDVTTELGYFTPALTQTLLRCCVNYSTAALLIRDPRRNLVPVESAVARLLPRGLAETFATPEQDTLGKAERAIRPESIAMAVFGGIAAVAALLIAGQLMSRQIRRRSGELETLRALGAGTAMLMADQLPGVLGAVTAGAALAVVVAVGLSPLAPLGPVRSVYPYLGLSFDWTVLAAGFAVLLLTLGAAAVAVAYRGVPHRAAARAGQLPARTAKMGRIAGSVGLPPSVVTGVRFALEPGSGRNPVPTRSATLGAAMAAIVVTTTVVFGASLGTLVSTPSLYGWNWTYVLSAGGGSGDIAEHQATVLLEHDRYVAAWSGAYFTSLRIDGIAVPVIGESPGAAVQPPVLSGHGLGAVSQVVLGPLTLASLHKQVGQTVTVSGLEGHTATLRIVGTATLPTVGQSGEQHLEMGVGAVLPAQLIPAVARNPFNNPLPGPQDILVRIRGGTNPATALRSLQAMSRQLSNTANFGVVVVPVQHPAEIVDYRSLGATPAFLGASLGAGVIVALALTLFASVRRKQHDLAVLKTLGFIRRQLAMAVCWQSAVVVGLGTVPGIALGIAAGRVLWDMFARDISAVPVSTIPAGSLLLIAAGALTVTVLVALIPAAIAARVPTALLLRTE